MTKAMIGVYDIWMGSFSYQQTSANAYLIQDFIG